MDNTPTKKIKWTILFIVHAVVEDTRMYSEKLFAELLEANIDPDKVQVFVLHDTYEYFSASKVHAILYEIKRNEFKEEVTNSDESKESVNEFKIKLAYAGDESEENTTRVKDESKENVAYGSNGSKKNAAYSNIREPHDLGSISITDEEGLNKVFKKVEKLIEFAEEKSQDKDENITSKLILVTWDHSNGFGFFDNSQTDLGIQIKKSSRRPDMLMVRELEKALKNYLFDKRRVTPGKKVEILMMMHCWMQNIEAGYQLKDVVKILIGAETVFDFQGYDFTKLISRISAPGFDGDEEQLARDILEDIPEKLKRIKHASPPEEIFVSATRPEHAGLIKQQIDKLALVLCKGVKTEENLRKILEARTRCFEITKVADGYTPWYFVDIFQAIKELESAGLDSQSIREISDSIDSIFKDQYIIGVKPLLSGKEAADFNNFRGVSICFPYQNDTFTIGTIYKTYYSVKSEDPGKIDFARDDPRWPTFLNELLTAVKDAVEKKANELRKVNKKTIKRKSPTVDDILSPVVKRQNFTLELAINFDIIESQFLVNSVVANCTAINESGEVTLFKVHPGDPKRGVPGDPKRGVPGDPKRGVPGDPKRGVPGELLSSNTEVEIEFREEQRKTQEDYLATIGIKF